MRAAQIETGQPPQNNIQPPALCLAAKQAKLVLDFYCCRMITEKKKGAIGTFLVSSRDNPFFSFTRRAGIIYFAPECCIIMYASIQQLYRIISRRKRRSATHAAEREPLCASDLFMKMGIKGVKFYYFT